MKHLRLLFACSLAACSFGLITASAPAAASTTEPGAKVVICHTPPGNPENRHTIEVSESAVPAHLAHGDTLGPCPVYPPTVTVTVTISPNPAAPGATVVITFTGCTAGESVTVTLNGVTVTVTCTGPAGTIRMPMAAALPSATASMTAPTAPGTYPVTATGLTSGFSATGTLTVTAPSVGGLPSTGSDSSSTLQIAALLVLVGGGLVAVGVQRRRRHA
jgi:LPXTG-motif cell wall-anchored protein